VISRTLPLLLLLALSANSHAAAGFIHSGVVQRGDVYAEINLKLSCNVHYVGHAPRSRSDVLRIQIEATTVCAGVAPGIAETQQIFRPQAADEAWLSSIEYDGQTVGDQQLRLSFNHEVRFDVRQINANNFLIRVFPAETETQPVTSDRQIVARRVEQSPDARPRFVINLASSQRAPTPAEVPNINTDGGQSVFVIQALINGATWYRTRLGYFESAEQASRELRQVRERFPRAWIDRVEGGDNVTDNRVATLTPSGPESGDPQQTLDTDEVATLMDEARRAMTLGELSRAVQLYTKVLRLPPNDYQPAAQEFLALARERNGQIAHAKAEYQRYLDIYGDTDGASRVRQRLNALMVAAPPPEVRAAAANAPVRQATSNPWKIRTFVAQHYRRDANQVNDLEEVVSQSSLYTDMNVDARRRGERFDFSARFSGGHRYDLQDEETNSGNDLRISYAYADLADVQTGLRGRFGRQTRNTGGVLGRFDGLNLSYALNERLQFDTVVGKPVYTTTEGVDDARSFYGVSSTFGLFHKNLDFGVFYLQQDIEGLTDRQAAGAEIRYFGERQSLWSVIDYDLEFGELGSVFVQGSWRLPANITITGLFDQRRSPFLNLGNAIIGQQLESFADLKVLYTEEEIRQLALDRAPESTTTTFGLSKPLTTKMQFNITASLTSIEATPESGGVAAMEASEYNYYSTDLVVSSLFTENDVTIFGLRYAESNSTDVLSANLDTRFRIGRRWRISPRLRVDYREIRSDQSTQWIYSPGIRLHYRHDQRFRFELEAGTQFSNREMAGEDQERKSYFVNAGYQWLF